MFSFSPTEKDSKAGAQSKRPGSAASGHNSSPAPIPASSLANISRDTARPSSPKLIHNKDLSLPSGVNERDLELFSSAQDQARHFLETQNTRDRAGATGKADRSAGNGETGIGGGSAGHGAIGMQKTGNEIHGVPTQVATPHLPSTIPGSAARSPLSIQFGKFEISTWYSSPYPQEYAR